MAVPIAVSAQLTENPANSAKLLSFAVPGAVQTLGVGINAGGIVAGSYTDTAQITHGILRNTDGVLTLFDAPGSQLLTGGGTAPTGINGAGAIVGSAHILTSIASFPLEQGFVRAPDGTFTEFSLPGTTATNPQPVFALCINDVGSVAGYYYSKKGSAIGFIRDASGGFSTFNPGGGVLQSTGTFVRAINASGIAAGYYLGNTLGSHGFTRELSGPIDVLDVPAALATEVTGINDAGMTTGFYTDASNVIHGFTHPAGGSFTTFDLQIGNVQRTHAEPTAINSQGTVIGSLHSLGFIHPAEGADELIDYPALTTPLSINDSGAIAGYIKTASGNIGFVRTP